MADTLVEDSIAPQQDQRGGIWGPYYINTTTGIVVYLDNQNDLQIGRTTDGGVGWTETEIGGAANVYGLAAYFDQETPGDTGMFVVTSKFGRLSALGMQ